MSGLQGVLAPYRTGEPTAITDLAASAAASTVTGPDAGTDTDGPWTISGTALGPDITRKDETLEWTPSALSVLGPTLADSSMGQQYPGDGTVVVDHGTGDASVVGALTHSAYDDDSEEIEYEAELDAGERGRGLSRSIENGELDVSPRLVHTHPDLLPVGDDGVRTVTGDAARRAVHISLVQSGAGESNTVTAGPLDGRNPDGTDLSALRRVRIDGERGRTTDTTTDMTSNNDSDSDSTDDGTNAEDWDSSDLLVAMGADRDDITTSSDLAAESEAAGTDPENLSAAEQRARDAASLPEIEAAVDANVTVAELIADRYDLSAAEHDSVDDLRAALAEAREEGE